MKVQSTILLLLLTGWVPAVYGGQSAASASKTTAQESKTTREVRAVLDAQVAAWNRGDLEGFMKGYWRSPELTFTSGTTQTSGWDETLARYKRRYQGEGREMGTLTFADISILPLERHTALARGRWKLVFSDGKVSEGLFTLVLKQLPEGWRVIHDHTS